jgi:hypothetical protein
MGVVKVVTGFIEIPNHPRTGEDYKALGEKLFEACKPHEVLCFDDPAAGWETTMLGRYMYNVVNIRHARADNPAKNTLAYHCIQNQKAEWLYEAMKQDTANPADVYCWIDYGILHLAHKGVTTKVIRKFLDKIQDYERITAPGCWNRSPTVDPSQPCWRFCGGVIVVPRRLVEQFYKLFRSVMLQYIQIDQLVTWEVNTLARMELLDQLPMTVYMADHDNRMFTNAP